ncbi:histidine kinase-like ATPase [Phycomyces blakesleeanus]|uniref:Histidine kinase-like ATPase n=1 Tax=Phycomyces blakesleeanus TaxID=4837 RepID=A0ABR3B658_PHYBL
MSHSTIKLLEPIVVNRIAAGEVIIRPSHVVKELIENAMDANSSQIDCVVKEGGIKLIQIKDNGDGIHQNDLIIACKSHTTSKLHELEDLKNMTTYGFRGEALASISHVSHVTLQSKTSDSICAYRAAYNNGQITSKAPHPCAGNKGTVVGVEDLFYNVPLKRKTLRTPREEYEQIVSVMREYAVHHHSISFTCKKLDSNTFDIKTTGKDLKGAILQLYGSFVFTSLLFIPKTTTEACCFETFVTNPSYGDAKSTKLLLFVNHRAVENRAMKKSIEKMYSQYIPQNMHPFVYISIDVPLRNIDVNIHPTKKHVSFLSQDKVIDTISTMIEEELAKWKDDTAKTTVNPQTVPIVGVVADRITIPPVKVPSCQGTLDRFLVKTPSEVTNSPKDPLATKRPLVSKRSMDIQTYCIPQRSQSQNQPSRNPGAVPFPERQPKAKRQSVQANTSPLVSSLESIQELQKDVIHVEDIDLTDLISHHNFVNIVDDSLAIVEHNKLLYTINYNVLGEEMFYQKVLNGCESFGRILLDPPVSICECLNITSGKEEEPSLVPTGNGQIESLLSKHAEMLKTCFSITVVQGHLISLPVLIRDYAPDMNKLPDFLLHFTQIAWEVEKECIDDIARELALLYTPPTWLDPFVGDPEWESKVQYILLPAMKTNFRVPKYLNQRYIQSLVSITDIQQAFS